MEMGKQVLAKCEASRTLDTERLSEQTDHRLCPVHTPGLVKCAYCSGSPFWELLTHLLLGISGGSS